jgi:hypothetical protein
VGKLSWVFKPHSRPHGTPKHLASKLGRDPLANNLFGRHPIYVDHLLWGAHDVFLLDADGMDIKQDQDENGDQYMIPLEYVPPSLLTRNRPC